MRVAFYITNGNGSEGSVLVRRGYKSYFVTRTDDIDNTGISFWTSTGITIKIYRNTQLLN